MSDFQEFLENSLQQKIKQMIPLTGGASADINRIILANDDELIVRRTLSQEKSVMAIPKILEAKIQKVVKKNGAPVPAIIFEFSEGEEIDVIVLDVDQRGRIKLSIKEIPEVDEDDNAEDEEQG